MAPELRKSTKASYCFIKDCAYSARPKHYVTVDGRRLQAKRRTQLFRFPLEPDRYERWVKATAPMLIDEEPGRLCKHHFKPKDFKNYSSGHIRLVLERHAVPDLTLDYPRRTPDPVREKPKATNIKRLLEAEVPAKRKSPTPNMKRVLGLTDNEFDDSDDSDDTDVDGIVETELGFKLDRDEDDFDMLSNDEYDESQLSRIEDEEIEDDESDDEVQMELMKIMAKKARAEDSSPPPSPYLPDDASPVPCSPEPTEDAAGKLFSSLEQVYRSLPPEIQVLTRQNLLSVMRMAEKMEEDLKKNDRLVLKQKVLKYPGKNK